MYYLFRCTFYYYAVSTVFTEQKQKTKPKWQFCMAFGRPMFFSGII